MTAAAHPVVADTWVRQWRHDLHRSPETAFGERATAAHGHGTAGPDGGTRRHSHDDTCNDDVLAVGVAFHVRVVDDALAG